MLPADGAAVVKSRSAATTVFLVAAPGQKFPIAGDSVLNAFGYAGVTPVTLPQQLLPLIPDGPALSSRSGPQIRVREARVRRLRAWVQLPMEIICNASARQVRLS